MASILKATLPEETDTLELGAALAPCLEPGLTIYLRGELGAGKTTLVRGMLRALGHEGPVRSPTYALVEVYELSRLHLHHFDFYRFRDPREWSDAGFRESFDGRNCDRHRMAGEGRNLVAHGGCGNTARVRRSGSRSRPHVEFPRGAEVPRAARASLRGLTRFFLSALLALAALPLCAAEMILASRVWPAQDYTRVTVGIRAHASLPAFLREGSGAPRARHRGRRPQRRAEGTADEVGANDPYIQSVRVGRNRPNVVRIVFDLKTEVKPSVFPLAPAGEYKHRLVLDIYPLKPPDPLLALLRPDPIREMAQSPMQERPAEAAATPVEVPPLPVIKLEPDRREPEKRAPKIAQKSAPIAKDRLVIVAIDAGHGGEDPGAKGRLGTREKDVTLAIAKRLKVLMDKEPNMRAVLVRDGDFFIPLAQRVSKSRRMQADILVSIHADAWVRPTRAARRYSPCPSAAPPPRRRVGSRSARTSRTRSAA
jgi:tRNA threonylcarbamoyl adenosine modification protein YjeE